MSKKKIYNDFNGIKLTTREWETYKLIKRNTIFGINTTQEDIVNNYPKFGYENGIKVVVRKDGYEWNNDPRVHDHCVAVWADINEINSADGIHKVIVSPRPYEYKIAESREEIENHAKPLYFDRAMILLKRYWNMIHKADRDGQGKLVFNESEARDYFETYLKGKDL